MTDNPLINEIDKLHEKIYLLEQQLAIKSSDMDPVYLRPNISKITCLSLATRLSGLDCIQEDYHILLNHLNNDSTISRSTINNDSTISRSTVIAFINTKREMKNLTYTYHDSIFVQQLCNCYMEKENCLFLDFVLGFLFILSPNDTRENKLIFCFRLLDTDKDDKITFSQLQCFILSSFKLLYEFQPGTEEEMGVDSLTLSYVTTDRAFRDNNLEKNQSISLDQLLLWYLK